MPNPSLLLMPELSLRWTAVWRRNQLVWRKLAIASVLGNIADPLLYMVALGYGIGSFVPEVGGMKYIVFIATGMVCQSAMFTASFEAMYSAFSRMHVQKTWDAILNTPLGLTDVVAGELFWAATKSLFSGAAILVVVAYNMSEWRVFKKLLRAPKSDVAVLVTTFGLTVAVDLMVAIEVGVVMAAMAAVLLPWMRPTKCHVNGRSASASILGSAS